MPDLGEAPIITGEPPEPLAYVDGWGINVTDLDMAKQAIVAVAQANTPFSVVTLNLDHVSRLRGDAAFREAYRKAAYVTADGAPVSALAARQSPDVQRTTGADLVLPLCRAAADADLGVFLFGSNTTVLDHAGTHLQDATDGRLSILGSEAPPYGFDPNSAEADAAIERIEASGARLCFVALGAPKQEIFAARAVERGAKVGFICIGAALDFLAGHQVRAPAFMRDNGLEWLWRLSTNPRRLTMRYARSGWVLGDIIVSEARNQLRGRNARSQRT